MEIEYERHLKRGIGAHASKIYVPVTVKAKGVRPTVLAEAYSWRYASQEYLLANALAIEENSTSARGFRRARAEIRRVVLYRPLRPPLGLSLLLSTAFALLR